METFQKKGHNISLFLICAHLHSLFSLSQSSGCIHTAMYCPLKFTASQVDAGVNKTWPSPRTKRFYCYFPCNQSTILFLTTFHTKCIIVNTQQPNVAVWTSSRLTAIKQKSVCGKIMIYWWSNRDLWNFEGRDPIWKQGS